LPDISTVNGIDIASIATVNGKTDAEIDKLDNNEFTAYSGITWSTDDAMPVAVSFGVKMGIIGAIGYSDCNTSGKATYEHNGSSWSTTGSCSTRHGVPAGGGTQSAGVIVNGNNSDAGDESNVTEEYNGSTWSTGNNTVEGSAYLTGGGTVQTAQLITGGSKYNPTVRDLSMTQSYNGTNWSNEGVASDGRGAASSGESGGGGLDAFLSASGSLDSPGEVTNTQLFDQSAGSWTSKAAVSYKRRYTASATDGTRVYKIAGAEYNASGGAQPHTNVVESWVDNTWTTESTLPAVRNGPGCGTGGVEATGGATAMGGNNASGKTTTYYTAAAS
jgi:hypothetical protein